MLAAISGSLALVLGLLLLLLPLLVTELSRPGDPALGAVVLVLGLSLVTSADRLTGSPMVAVICGALLVGRLSAEVGRGRWHQLSEDEQQRLRSGERWRSSGSELAASITLALGTCARTLRGLGEWLAERRRSRPVRRWVRPDGEGAAAAEEAEPTAAGSEG
ncbi:hypothetical protein EVJ50_08460 [Synechococcus sp. RSCCF101]|uniref:hypothetical protein n=1 Tax=Synechococcus sp. RSCCF101 TaxID=2511069 RepID=UPI0012452320|nr:hypothetical protein [Synechococcus sp. RSCCF101]QEY32247.1 hypothetical protein EVJ50_08460 [Synechococcus sp. RSCCF101]